MTLWSSSELFDVFPQSKESQISEFFIKGISIDSRTIQQGDLFIALDGDPGPEFNSSVNNTRDGHDFIPMAISNGAAALLVSKKVDTNVSQINDTPQILVHNTLKAMQQLARAARKRTKAKIAGITGSSGKTTVKSWLDQLLVKQGQTHASTGSLNNHWGVPLSLSRMPQNSDYGIFEIGTNHPGEIAPLSKLVSPDVAMVLNVLPAHIGNFAGLSDIRKEKLSIVEGLNQQGVLIVPVELDIEGLDFRKIVTFGLGAESGADVYGEASFSGAVTSVKAMLRGQAINYDLNVHGDHRVLSSLAVLAMLDCLGGDIHKAAKQFCTLTTPGGRGNVQTLSGIHVIDDSYNANPASMSYAIKALRESSTNGRRIAILGEMLELGDQSLQSHHDIAKEAQSLDGVITIGDGFKEVPGSWGHLNSSAELDITDLLKGLSKGDSLLIKGSNKVFWQSGFVKKLIAALELI